MSSPNFRYFAELNVQKRTLERKWAILDRLAEGPEHVYRRDEERVLGMLVHAGLVEVYRKPSGHSMAWVPLRRNWARLTDKGREAVTSRQLPAGRRRPERRPGGAFRGT